MVHYCSRRKIAATMSVFMDLNVTYTGDKDNLRRLVETAAQLGYSTVAINYTFELTKKKKEVPKPTQIKELFEQLPIVQGRSRPIRVLNRLTVVMSESSHFRSAAPEYRDFDILALQPTTEKLFHAACMTYDVDIICVIVTEKLPFHFKRGSVNGAIDRGVMFEISYAAAIRDSTMRRYTIANAVNLVERSKGKGVIISSAAERALELRGPYDIANLALLFGLSDKTAKEAVSSTCHSVVRHAEIRRTGSGIVCTTRVCTESSDQQGAPAEADTCEAPAAKKHKTDGVTSEEGGAKTTSAL